MYDRVCHNDVTVNKLIFEYISKHKGMFFMYMIFVFIIPLQEVGVPHFFGKLTKAIQDKADLKYPLAFILGITILLQFAYSIFEQLNTKMIPTIQKFVRDKILTHIFETQKSNYEELQIGKITPKLIKMPGLMYSYMEEWKDIFIPKTFVFIIAIVYFLNTDIVIGTSLFILIASFIYIITSTVFVCENIAQKRDNTLNNLYEEIDDILRNSMTVLNYNQEDSELNKLDMYHKEYTKLNKQVLDCATNVRYTYIPILSIYLVFFTYYMYNKVKSNQISTASFISLFMMMIYITNSLWSVIGSTRDMIINWGAFRETLNMFKICYNQREDSNVHIQNYPGILLNNVSYIIIDSNGISKTICKNINLHIRPHEKTLIIGQIGSGKSSLLKLIMKYAEVSTGEIYLDNIPYSKMKNSDLRKFIGFVQQNPILFNRTIYENISYGMPWVTKEHVQETIINLNLSHIFNEMPNGIDTNVGKNGSHLSGGQRQIIWILRTIIQDPEIIIMDEPTASLDEKTKNIVYRLLDILMKNKTIIMVTHDKNIIKEADRIIEMKNGEIITDYKN